MNHEIIKECSLLSDEEKINFPEVIRRLLEAKVELYYADIPSQTKTYYGENSALTVSGSVKSPVEVAEEFKKEGIVRAIKESQSGKIKYQEFLKKAMEAGVISYMVFIRGKKVIYFGRKGEEHIEMFPT